MVDERLLPDWQNRRKIIFYALYFCAGVTALIIMAFVAIALVELFLKTGIDPNVVSLLSSAMYTVAFVATSIIGSYVFGVNMDWANTRQHITQIVTGAGGGSMGFQANASGAPAKNDKGRD
jgi:cellobiose-specific phosphotransferase system component IIC